MNILILILVLLHPMSGDMNCIIHISCVWFYYIPCLVIWTVSYTYRVSGFITSHVWWYELYHTHIVCLVLLHPMSGDMNCIIHISCVWFYYIPCLVIWTVSYTYRVSGFITSHVWWYELYHTHIVCLVLLHPMSGDMNCIIHISCVWFYYIPCLVIWNVSYTYRVSGFEQSHSVTDCIFAHICC